jgi:hypothetical protein
MREEVAKKERDDHFNAIGPVIPDKARVEGEGEDQCPCTHGL